MIVIFYRLGAEQCITVHFVLQEKLKYLVGEIKSQHVLGGGGGGKYFSALPMAALFNGIALNMFAI